MKDAGFRKKKARQESTVVVMTAFNSQDLIQRAKKVGMKKVLVGHFGNALKKNIKSKLPEMQ